MTDSYPRPKAKLTPPYEALCFFMFSLEHKPGPKIKTKVIILNKVVGFGFATLVCVFCNVLSFISGLGQFVCVCGCVCSFSSMCICFNRAACGVWK